MYYVLALTYILAAGFLPQLFSARHVPSRRAMDSYFTTAADSDATCLSFASSWGLSVETLQSLNPGITYPSIDTRKSYCVVGTVETAARDGEDENNPKSGFTVTADPTTTTTTSTATSTTTTSTTNSPTMPGLADDCDGYHKNISVAQCKTWNTYIDGATSASIPFPTMSGIISTWKSYYQVQSGDSCWSIYSATGITLSQFLSYNTAVDSSCSNLWLGYYVCIGV
ncbi:hypothetical protein B0J13DRAFT_591294 [Dactylonectria estremocensis]|uniref:LysM domain-containing protein n=1 Tax=Dactylonectria estremocensis TaxID=1079267 RepID=A0A9P9CY20_9HYPO|nr:hypothetical protein B0J13DRAFT_591294 [Dactylonectria estremocensis]